MRCFSVLLFAILVSAGIAAQTPTATLRELNGRVEVMVPGSADWVLAEPGMRIEGAALVSTGFRSTAILALGNSTITVQPLTRLSLEEIVERQGSEQISVYLRTGRVRAEVRPPVAGKTDFTIRSPIATASVRGTVFDFDTVNLRVAEGRVEFTGSTGSMALVRRGETSSAHEISSRVSVPAEERIEALAPASLLGTDTGDAAEGAAPSPPGSLELTLILESAP
jgi:hypothetical protein